MNAIAVSGRLTQDPELVHRNNRSICNMRLAVDNGKYNTTFIDVRTFDEQAYICTECLQKGSRVAVTGRLVYDEWRADDDTKRERYSVIGWVEFLEPRREQPGEQAADGEHPRADAVLA